MQLPRQAFLRLELSQELPLTWAMGPSALIDLVSHPMIARPTDLGGGTCSDLTI